MKWVRRYWGLVVLALLLLAWTRDVGPGSLLLLSGLVTFWGAFQAPVICGVPNRVPKGTFCKNNARGLLMGCHFRDHKWQKLRGAFYSRHWQAFTEGMWTTPRAWLATVSSLIGIVTGVIFLVDWIF